MSNRGLPMLPWWPKEFAVATATWSFAERAAYRALLDVQWEIGVLPNEPWRLAQSIGMPLADFEGVWPVVSRKFAEVEGGLLNKRLEEHRLDSLKRKHGHATGAEITNAKRRAKRDAERNAEHDAEHRAIRGAQRGGERIESVTPPSPSPSPESKTPLPPRSGGASGRKRAAGTNPRARGTNPRAIAEILAVETTWQRLRDRAQASGFRAAYPVESADVYETQLRLHEREAREVERDNSCQREGAALTCARSVA